jgi:hypothetical protein
MKENTPALAGAGAQVVQTEVSRNQIASCTTSAAPSTPETILFEDDRLAAFRRRCLARVAAVRSGRLSLSDTITSLRAAARRERLTGLFGEDTVEDVLTEVFAGCGGA